MKSAKKLIFTVIMLTILMSYNQSNAIDDSNLVAYLTFDEGAGFTAYDSAGNNDGAIYGAQWTEGKIGSALYFDGINDYVEVQDDVSLQPGYITMSAWIKTQKKYTAVIDKCRYSDAYSQQYSFGVFSNGKAQSGIKRGSSCLPGVGGYPCNGETDLVNNNWYLVTSTWDGITLKMYVNGQLDGINSSIPPGPIYICQGATLRCGNHWSKDPAWYKGIIDDVRIYNRALTENEVEQLYLEAISLPVAVDIKPAACPNPLNVKSRGVLPVAILGSETFDVNSIDIVSVRLAGVAPVRSGYEDVATPVSDANDCACTAQGPDGYIDLVLKFKTPDIAAALVDTYGTISKGDIFPLTLTGTLTNSRPIIGEDCIVIVGKAPRELTAMRSDVNRDGIIDFLDFACVAEYWLEPAFVE